MPEFPIDPLDRENLFEGPGRELTRGKLMRLDIAIAAQYLFAKRLAVVVTPTIFEIWLATMESKLSFLAEVGSFLLSTIGRYFRIALFVIEYYYDVHKMNSGVSQLFLATGRAASQCYQLRLFQTGRKHDNKRKRRRVWSRN